MAPSSTCAATRGAASASPTSCGPTSSRTRDWTRSTPTSELGLPVDTRDYGIGAAILHDLGVGRIRLLTNNPAKVSGLTAFGVDVAERVPLVTTVHEDNAAYLRTKRERLGHRYEAD